MDWDDLRYVLAVGRQRTLAAAGRELRVDATTVGRKILAIEEQLGTRLFDRTADGFVPTHTGEVAIARAAEVEQQTLALEREVSGLDARVEGPVRITALDSFFDDFVIPRVPRLLARHPGLELSLVSDVRVFDLSRREADVGVRYFKPRDPDLVGRKLGTLATALYAARDFVIGDAPALIGVSKELEDTPEGRLVIEAFPTGRIVARGSTPGHLISLARAGCGIAMIECHAGDADPALRRVSDRQLVDDLWAVVHRDMHRAPRVRAVIDFLAEIVAEDAARLMPPPAPPGE